MKQDAQPYLLIVEDSDEDFASLQRVLSKSCNVNIPIERCYDGEDALAFLYRTGQYADRSNEALPNLILLDLNLPGTDGREVLNILKQDKQLKIIPIVVLTTSSNPKDVETCYRYGANSYLLKQMRIDQLKHSVCLCMDYWMKVAVLPNTAPA
ncbi:MAG: response regulator [Phormidesmis sp.]